MIEAIISVLIPILVREAEQLLGSKPVTHDWIVGLVDEIALVLESYLPNWIKPEEKELKVLIEEAIEKLIK